MDGQKYKVIKISNAQGLAIEIYRHTDEGPFFIDSKTLTDKKTDFINLITKNTIFF